MCAIELFAIQFIDIGDGVIHYNSINLKIKMLNNNNRHILKIDLKI